MSPRRTTTTSPGTRSRDSTSTRLPSRHARDLRASVWRSASRADSARASSMKPMNALTKSRPRMMPKSTCAGPDQTRRRWVRRGSPGEGAHPVADHGGEDAGRLDEEGDGAPEVAEELEDHVLLVLGDLCRARSAVGGGQGAARGGGDGAPLGPNFSRRALASSLVRPFFQSVVSSASSSSSNFSLPSGTARRRQAGRRLRAGCAGAYSPRPSCPRRPSLPRTPAQQSRSARPARAAQPARPAREARPSLPARKARWTQETRDARPAQSAARPSSRQ